MVSSISPKHPLSRPRVLMGDDHALILDGFRTVLGGECELVGAVTDGESLLKAALQLKPDVVILDIGMPVLNGIDAARQIKKSLPRTNIIFVTMHANPSYLRGALAAGAAGYVLKTSARDELLMAVRQVLRGECYVTPGFGEWVVKRFGRNPGKLSKVPSLLTSRQRQILQLIAEGRSAKEMATILSVSLQTIAFHKYHLMNKLSIRNTAELIKYAIQEGLVQLEVGTHGQHP